MTAPSLTDFLTTDDLLQVAAGILPEVRLRDAGLLASAAARPQTSAFGAPAYPTFPQQAAALLHALARNHPLVDGNKRLAWAATRTFCLINGRDLRYDVDDAERFVVAVAAGELDVQDAAAWIAAHLSEAGLA